MYPTHAIAVGFEILLIFHVGCKVIRVVSHEFNNLQSQIHVIELIPLYPRGSLSTISSPLKLLRCAVDG